MQGRGGQDVQAAPGFADHESSLPQDIKKHFWESVKASFAEAQAIIIENSHQLPSDGTLTNVNVVLFTGNDQGRRCFIPRATGVA